jgi:hypothetical protein
MYCGAVLPNPAASPLNNVPDGNLDELVRATMSGKASIRTIEAALAKKGGTLHTRPARVERVPLLTEADLEDIPSGALAPIVDDEPLYTEEGALPEPARTMPEGAVQPLLGAELAGDFAGLFALLVQSRTHWETGHLNVAGDKLAQMQMKAAELRSRLREAAQQSHQPVVSAARSVPKVSVRMVTGKAVSQPFCLYVECPGDANAAPRIVRALGVDGVTAHSLAVCRYPRAARRGDDQPWLEAMAERYRSGLGLLAAVIPRGSLLDIGLPRVVLGPAGRSGFQVSTAPLWTGATHDPIRHSSGVQSPPIQLVVPGAVVVSHYRGTNRGRGRGYGYILGRESRLGVIDLHGPGVFLRVIEGITDFNNMPGHDPLSVRRSFRGFLDQLGLWYPGVRKLGPRVSRPEDPPDPDPDQPLLQKLAVDGWSDWEEHTRLCRLMVKVPAT